MDACSAPIPHRVSTWKGNFANAMAKKSRRYNGKMGNGRRYKPFHLQDTCCSDLRACFWSALVGLGNLSFAWDAASDHAKSINASEALKLRCIPQGVFPGSPHPFSRASLNAHSCLHIKKQSETQAETKYACLGLK